MIFIPSVILFGRFLCFLIFLDTPGTELTSAIEIIEKLNIISSESSQNWTFLSFSEFIILLSFSVISVADTSWVLGVFQLNYIEFFSDFYCGNEFSLGRFSVLFGTAIASIRISRQVYGCSGAVTFAIQRVNTKSLSVVIAINQIKISLSKFILFFSFEKLQKAGSFSEVNDRYQRGNCQKEVRV